MPKPDLVKAHIRRDGTVLRDVGKGFSELAVKGATSEELCSFVYTENVVGGAITIPNIPLKDSFKIMFELKGIAGVFVGVRYILRFNGDVGNNYVSGSPATPTNRIVLASTGMPMGSGPSDITRLFGSIAISNNPNDIKMGNGIITTNRLTRFSGAFPIFAWLNDTEAITSISILAESALGVIIPNHEFCAGSKIKILGRDF